MEESRTWGNGVLFDKQRKIISVPKIFEPDSRGLGYVLYKCMRSYKDQIAQYIADTGEEDTYGELLKRSLRTALWLKTRNLKKDDIVCLCTSSHKDSIVPFIAAQFLNRTTAALDPSFVVDDAKYLIEQVKPKIFFVVPESVKLIEQAIEAAGVEAEIVVFGDTSTHTSFSDFLEPHAEANKFTPEAADDVFDTAVILFSSGTTGLPKGICLHHYGLLGQTANLIYLANLRGDLALKDFPQRNSGCSSKVTLAYTSLYWISAVIIFTAAACSGTARVVCKSYDEKEIWRLIPKYKVSYIFLSPIQAIEMIKAGRPSGLDTTSLHTLMTGGASFPEPQLEKLRKLLPDTVITQGYGQTEVSSILTMYPVTDVKNNLHLYHKPSSVGRPVPGLSYRVIDVDTGKVRGPNEKGELRVKTDFALNGYYNMDSSKTFDSEGWLKTGDIVYYDEDFCFFVVDRIKELLKYRSWHIPPAKIEQVLSNHPAVKQSVVVGIPHTEDGEWPMALVILGEGFNDVTPEEIEEFAAERLDERERLRGGVKFLSEFPLTPTGKIKRKTLRDMVLSGLI